MGLRKTRPGKVKGSSVKGTYVAPVFVPCVVGTASFVSCTVPQRREVTAWREHLRARGTIPIERLCTTQVSPTWQTAITPHRPRRHYPLRHPRHCPPRPRPYPPLGHPSCRRRPLP